jgi:hypothetical protein
MESIYWVLCWACHRKCVHCYDDRFRPYVREELETVIAEGETNFPLILSNLPEDMSHRGADGGRRPGRIILAGGEVLLDGFRERVFFPALEAIRAKWGANGTARVFVQTTGDLLEQHHLEAMLARGVWSIAISGFDDYHVGMTGDRREELRARIDAMMARYGVTKTSLGSPEREDSQGPFYLYFGARPGSWIGELWPRGRAWLNDISTATYETNFCARHAGAKGFLDTGLPGSEVAIEPNGNVFPCCLKTKAPLGNLTEEPLLEILDSLRGIGFFESLNRGDPEGMALDANVSRENFRELSRVVTATGRTYENPCIGCDRVFEAKVRTLLRDLRARRMSRHLARAH